MTHTDTIISIARGLGLAILVTLAGMAILAALVILTPMPDSLLTTLNQLLKVLAIYLGTLSAVGRHGERGFVKGGVCGLMYMILGYLVYSIIDGKLAPASQMAVEFALGCVIGALSGAICANLKPKRKRQKRATPSLAGFHGRKVRDAARG